jgi:hypothetical protein
MKEGLYTGKSLNAYINDAAADFAGARSIVNGDGSEIPKKSTATVAEIIMRYAQTFETALGESCTAR